MLNSRFIPVVAASLALGLGACGVDPASNPAAVIPPNLTDRPNETIVQPFGRGALIRDRVRPAVLPQTNTTRPSVVIEVDERNGSVPNIRGNSQLFFGPGNFTSASVTAPGSATYDTAPVVDPFASAPPATFGGGSYQITVNNIAYASATAESMSGVFPDDTGAEYLVVSAWTETFDPATGITVGTVVHTIVPATDFAIGATVNFDGVDRLAFFATGDINAPDPSVVAAATTGSITFTAGSLTIGDLITATMTGDFAEVAWMPSQPPAMGGNISAGMYTMTYDPQSYVMCDGTLAGQEASFAAIDLAALSFVNGVVDVQASATGFTIDGAPIASGYGGASQLPLDALPDAPPGIVGGFVNFAPPPAGPANTFLQGTYLVLDGDTASPTLVGGFTGAGYLTADQLGYCEVAFTLTLTP